MKRLLVSLGLAAFVAANAFAADLDAGKKLVTEKGCVACHGANGESPTSPDNPKLAGQHPDYIVKALSDYKSGRRKNPIMNGMAANLTQAEMENLAAWFSSQNGLHVKR